MIRRNALIVGGAVLAAGAGGWRLSTGSAATYDRWTAALRAWPQPRPEAVELVRLASLAPNGHNTQPWCFRVGSGRIDVVPDFTRRTPVVDPDDHHLWVSLGAAAETLAIAGAALGRPGEITLGPGGPVFAFTEAAARPDPLAEAIPRRQSTRGLYDGAPLSPEDLEALRRAAALPGVRMVPLTDPATLGRLRDLVLAGNTQQLTDPAFMAELRDWIRFNPRAAMVTGDGLFAAASGSPSLPTALGRALFDQIVTPARENERYAAQMASSAGCAVFLSEAATPEGWMTVGRACQRFLLAATARGIRAAFVNQPVEVPALRPELASLAGEPGLRPDLLIRFGRGPLLPPAPRRPLAAVLLPG